MAINTSQADQLSVNLASGAQQLSLALTTEQIDLLIQFLRILNKWNRVYNLTAVRSIDDMVGRHVLDSLAVLQWLPPVVETSHALVNKDATADVLDVGSGGGLPVIPLAILRPDLQFVSVESNGKKTRFQHQALLELGVRNVRVKQERVESTVDMAHTIVSRAFTAPERFLSAVEKNCLSGSQVIIMLGKKERMPEQLPSGFTLVEIREVDVPQCESIRHVAVCRKQ